MNNTFKKLFAPIRAEEALKERTRTFLAEKTRGYTKADAEGGRYSLCAACACALFLVLLGRWLYFTPTVEISIDINPSIELGINRFDQVIFVNGFNEDGQELSSTLHLKHKNYTKALEEILHHGHIEALLAGNEVGSAAQRGSKPPKFFPALRHARQSSTTPIVISPLRRRLQRPMNRAFPAANTELFWSCSSLTPALLPKRCRG